VKKTMLVVTGRGGPAAEYVMPKLARRADCHVLVLTAQSPQQARETARWAQIIEPPPVEPSQGGSAAIATITQAAVRVGASAVITFSEYAVLSAALACQELGLPGPGPNVRNARDKVRMRATWQEAGVPVPRFVPVRSLDDLVLAGAVLAAPFLVKAAWGAGSIGHRLIDGRDDLEVIWAGMQDDADRAVRSGATDYAYPQGSGQFIAEDIIAGSAQAWYSSEGYGDYVSVEGIVAAGEYHPICVTGRLPTIEPFTELGNLAPCALCEPLHRIIESSARRAVDALDLDTCGTHTEIKLLPDHQLCLIETAARLPGAMVTREVEEVFEFDLVDALAGQLLGECVKYPPRMLVHESRGAAASVALIGTDTRGTPWKTRPRFDASKVDWPALTSPGTTVEVVGGATVTPGSPMPRYDAAAGTLNFAGLAFVTAADPPTLLGDTRRIIDGLESALAPSPRDGTSSQSHDARPQVVYEPGPPQVDEVIDLFRRAPLNGPLDDPERIHQMLDRAQYQLSARAGGLLVGYIRVLTDFAFNAFVADLAVRPEFQHQGIGGELLTRATQPFRGVKFVVQPGPDSAGFYLTHGFEPALGCMVRPRSE
jgi:biotin carboxylase/GNAT superfamily N-acetyltransferase